MKDDLKQRVTHLIEWKKERELECNVTGIDFDISKDESELIDLMSELVEELNDLSEENRKLKKQLMKFGSLIRENK